jgi:hydroxyacylglutathione hydrolase
MSTPIDQVRWIHGAPDCAMAADPLIQTHQFDDNTFVFRVSKCFSFEGNFLYLLFGRERAILLDTGGRADDGSRRLPVRETVEAAVARWQQAHGRELGHLIVAHTHGHGDHAFGDAQFAGRPRTTIVKPTLAAVMEFFGLPHWPEGEAALELGERTLTVLPLPGHDSTHIAIYDAGAKLLLTGDTLYPGLLTVRDWTAYRRSAERLATFARDREVAFVLGAHIEMKKTPGELYPVGTTFQPDEHALPLHGAHIQEWHAACAAMGSSPRRDVHADFIIDIVAGA